jgi:VanZ family protein
VLWAAVIWLASSFSWGPLPVDVPGWVPTDKVAHSLIFGVLAWLIARPGSVSRGVVLRAWLLATLWGALDEWHQSWVPGRFSDVRDAAADAVGAALGLAAWSTWKRRNRQSA